MGRSHMKGLLKGRKFSNKHSTVIPAAVPVVAFAKGLPEVRRIVIGLISPTSCGPRRLKISDVPAGLKAQVRGPDAVQLLFIYTSDPGGVAARLTAFWNEEN